MDGCHVHTNIVPGNFHIAFADNSLNQNFHNIDAKNIKDKIEISVAHFKMKSRETHQDISIARNKLETICERYNYLLLKLERYK